MDLEEPPDILSGIGLAVFDVLDGVGILMKGPVESEVSLYELPPTQLAA